MPGGVAIPIQVALVAPARVGCEEMSFKAAGLAELLRTFLTGKLHPQMGLFVAQQTDLGDK